MDSAQSVPVDQLVSTRWSSDSDEDRFSVEEPATGKVLAEVQGGGAAEIDRAVSAAHAAFNEDWRWRSPRERGRFLRQAGDAIRVYADEIAALESREMGKPLAQAALDVDFLAMSLDYFGGLAEHAPGNVHDAGELWAVTSLEPYGVIGGIIPFNWPPIHTGGKSAPALAVGNTVVLKPPEQGPLSVMRCVDVLQEVLPDDVIHVVPGLGATTGQALASHPLVAKMSFTGSPQTAVAVLKTLADNLTPALMELGGKNPLIVFDDADLDLAVAGIIEGAFYNQGEACTAASRILVHRSLHDEVVARLADAVPRLRVGDPLQPGIAVGPLVTAAQQQRVMGYLELGVAEGARIVAQAPLPEDPRLASGFWAPPTVFADVTRDMRIAREEIFGPVTVVIPFDDDAEAIEIANDTDFGLVAALFSADGTRALAAGRRIDAGIVFVNNYHRGILGTPFGGTKHSGYGREHSPETLAEFGRSKTFRMASGNGTPPRWPVLEQIFDRSDSPRSGDHE